jgi:hypothetical protein
MNAPAANNPPPPPPPPPPIFINLDLLTGSNGLVTQQPRPAWNHTQIAGQDPRGHHYLDELSRKYCKDVYSSSCRGASQANHV